MQNNLITPNKQRCKFFLNDDQNILPDTWHKYYFPSSLKAKKLVDYPLILASIIVFIFYHKNKRCKKYDTPIENHQECSKKFQQRQSTLSPYQKRVQKKNTSRSNQLILSITSQNYNKKTTQLRQTIHTQQLTDNESIQDITKPRSCQSTRASHYFKQKNTKERSYSFYPQKQRLKIDSSGVLTLF